MVTPSHDPIVCLYIKKHWKKQCFYYIHCFKNATQKY